MGERDEVCVCVTFLLVYNTLKVHNSVDDLSEMLAIGLDLPAKSFREAGKYGYSTSALVNLSYLTRL